MKLTYPEIFKNKNFMLLWLGRSVSKLGNTFYSVAMMWYIYRLTGSPISLGISTLCTTLPIIIFKPIGGVIADRYNKKKIIVITDLLNGLFMLLLALLVASGYEQLFLLYLFMVIVSTVSAFFEPAVSASVPLIVDHENLPKANSLSQFSSQITSIVGPALAGVLIAFVSMWVLFLINGISFIISALSECFISIPSTDNTKAVDSFFTSFKEGFDCIIKEKNILYIVYLGAVINFFLAPLNIYGTMIASDILMIGSEGLGLLFSSLSIGALIGSILVLGEYIKNIYKMTVFGLSFEGLALILMGYFSNHFIALILILAFLGFNISLASIGIGTLYQSVIPKEKMGRVMSLVGMLLSISIPLGSLFGAIIVNYILISVALGISGILVIIITLMISPIILRLESKAPSSQLDIIS